MLSKILTTLVTAATLVALLGCNEAAPPDDGGDTTPAVTATSPVTAPKEQPAPEEDASAPVDDDFTSGAVATGDGMEVPADLVDEPWQAGNITLGLPVAEARRRMPVHESIPRQETWAVDNYTGVMTAGTYADPIRRVLAVICYEGEVVGVNDSMREADEKFVERYDHLVDTLGASRRDTPEFADGRQFIYEMTHAEPAPDRQYMWADEATQSMYFAARFTEQSISNFALINAAVYDEAASAMEALNAGGQ